MFPKTSLREDSDHSISEEEVFSPDWPEKCVRLGETSELKGAIQIQSQLEVLKDSHEITHGTELTDSLNNKGQTGLSSEDEVEVPNFQDDGGFASSPRMASISYFNEGMISNDQRMGRQKLGSQKPGEACTWSAVNKEAEALVYLNENARSSSMHLGSSHPKKTHKGRRGNAKPKLLFRFQSNREDTSSALSYKNGVNLPSGDDSLIEELKGVNKSTNENLMAEPLIVGGTTEQLVNSGVQTEPIFGCGYTIQSMIDLLDSYQNRVDVPTENTEMMVDEGSISPIGDRKLDYEEPPEALDSGSSSDDETHVPKNVDNLELIVPISEQKTMTDKFEEVFGVVTANEGLPNIPLHSIGVFGKLQQVIQSEKKREMEFLKWKQTCDTSLEKMSCIDVEILSRYLEAKLIICCCSLIQEKEHPHKEQNCHAMNENLRGITIIFSPRACNDVEVEVGNLIRIYSPWKEVRIGERDEIIILSTFFSQIHSC